MERIYLQLEFGSGKFYTYSKTEQEGYVRHESSTGKVSYRKYFDLVKGVLEGVNIYKKKMGDSTVEQLSFIFTYNGTTIYAPFQLYDQKNNISTFAEEAIKYLDKLEKGEYYEMKPYNFIPEGEKYSKIGITFRDESGEKLERALSNAYYNREGGLVEGDIPAVKWVKKRGKNMPDAKSLEEKTDYLYDYLTEQLEDLEGRAPSSGGTAPGEDGNAPASPKPKQEEKPAPKKEEKPSKKKEEVEEEEDDDTDLPF